MDKKLKELVEMIRAIHKRDLIDWIVVVCFLLGGVAAAISIFDRVMGA